MTDNQLIDFFLNNIDLFSNNNIFSTGLRIIGWLIVKAFVFLADVSQSLYDTAFGLVDFTTWSDGNEFMSALRPALVALMAISLFALGIMLMAGKDKKPKVVQNLCIACLCVTCSTVVFGQLNDLTVAFKDGIEDIKVDGKVYNGAYDIVSENLYDLVYMDSQIGMRNINYEKNKDKLPHPDIDKKSFSVIDYSEIINYDTERFSWKSGGEAQTILKKELITEGDGYSIGEVYNGIGWQDGDEDDIFNEFYYRYKFDFFPALIQLGAVIIVYIAMSYKVVRLIIELFVGKILAYLFSAEVSGGQKITEILIFIRNTYILLLITTLLIRVFYFATAYCQSQIDNTLAECIIILFVAFVIIDGPNLVERLLGMDAGLSSSTARIFAAYHTMKAAAHTATAPIRWGANKAEEHRRMDRYFGNSNNRNSDSSSNTGNERTSENNDMGRTNDTSFMERSQQSQRNSQNNEETDRRSDRSSHSNQKDYEQYNQNQGNSEEGSQRNDADFMNQSPAEKNEENGSSHTFMDEDLRDHRSNNPRFGEDIEEKDRRERSENFDKGNRQNDHYNDNSSEKKSDMRDEKSSLQNKKEKFNRSSYNQESFMDKREERRLSSTDKKQMRYESEFFRRRKNDRGRDK